MSMLTGITVRKNPEDRLGALYQCATDPMLPYIVIIMPVIIICISISIITVMTIIRIVIDGQSEVA